MKSFFSFILILFLVSCSGNSDDIKNCQFLLDQGINHSENLSFLPLKGLSTGNSIVINVPNTRGIIITNTGGGYVAFDAADPNHTFNSCSVLTVSYPIGTCNCEDGNKFNLIDGAPVGNEETLCPLTMYRTEVIGGFLKITN